MLPTSDAVKHKLNDALFVIKAIAKGYESIAAPPV
jgi:hypothetical protein